MSIVYSLQKLKENKNILKNLSKKSALYVFCNFCKKPTEKSRKSLISAILRSSNTFCSQSCQRNFRKKSTELTCSYCTKLFNRPRKNIRLNRNKDSFCSRKCIGLFKQSKKIKNLCVNCNKILSSKNKFCNKICHRTYKKNRYIERWLNNLEDGCRGKDGISTIIRNYLFEKYNSKCQKCNWGEINKTTGKVPLTINHIDGDHKNNRPENLELICPNCHSLTYNYCALNKGKGRKNRHKVK